MNYRKVMTKLNENNVTYVIQTITSMNYFDSSRKNLTGHDEQCTEENDAIFS
jgi:hypothetical protein